MNVKESFTCQFNKNRNKLEDKTLDDLLFVSRAGCESTDFDYKETINNWKKQKEDIYLIY